MRSMYLEYAASIIALIVGISSTVALCSLTLPGVEVKVKMEVKFVAIMTGFQRRSTINCMLSKLNIQLIRVSVFEELDTI